MMGSFREFIEKPPISFSDLEVANMYFGYPRMTVKEILDQTGMSKQEFYNIVHRHGIPNRLRVNHHNVFRLADQGMPLDQIAQATKYSTQNVKYILRKRLVENG
jgi:DNA-binding transcriptional regulator GbsR (MarR family)